MKNPALQSEWVAPARTALLVIDIQVDFAAPDWTRAPWPGCWKAMACQKMEVGAQMP